MSNYFRFFTKYTIITFVIIVSHISIFANSFFNDKSILYKNAYQKIIQLKFKDAQTDILQLKKTQPQNALIPYLESYIDFLTLFINEEKKDYEFRLDKRDDKLEIIKNSNKNSPYYYLSQAEIYLQWAFVKFKFGDYMSGSLDFKRAYDLIILNQKKYPNFSLNLKCEGIITTILGVFPEKYEWMLSLIGMHGSIEKGLSLIDAYAVFINSNNNYAYLKEECVIFEILIHQNISSNLNKVEDLLVKIKNTPAYHNPISVFVYASACLQNNKAQQTIDFIKEVDYKNNKYFYFSYINYQMGDAKLRNLDADAKNYFQEFINTFNGIHYIKSAYQKLAWCYLISNDLEAYKRTIKKCLNNDIKIVDADQQAYKEAKEKKIPNAALLKARLLFDGGYFDKAKNKIHAIHTSELKTQEDSIEYIYRKGRIYDKLSDYDKAIDYYKKTIDAGKNLSFYYASNSAYHAGIIFEKKEKYDLAYNFFNKAINMTNHDYESSIEQKSKAGLGRIQKHVNY